MANIDCQLAADEVKAKLATETSRVDPESTKGTLRLTDLFETANNAHDVDLDMSGTAAANGLYDLHKQQSNDKIHVCHCVECNLNFKAGILEQANSTCN